MSYRGRVACGEGAGAEESGGPMPFVLLALVTWRVTHLLVDEDGPNDVVLRLRRAAGSSTFGRAMDCFYCASLWVAAPIAAAATRSVRAGAPWWRRDPSRPMRSIQRVTTWMALSAAACLLERLTTAGAARADVAEPGVAPGETHGAPHPHRLVASGSGS